MLSNGKLPYGVSQQIMLYLITVKPVVGAPGSLGLGKLNCQVKFQKEN